MPEGKSAARQERTFGRALRGLLAAHSSGVIMMSCAIWISFLFRLPSRSPSILPNASRERAACSSLVSLPSALRSFDQDPLIQRHSRMNVASTNLVFRASAFFERQGRRANQSVPRSSPAPTWIPFRLMRRRRRPSPRRRDRRPSSQTSSVRSPECSIAEISPFLSASSFPFRPFDINKRRAASTASPPEARSPRERIKDAERARKRSST